MKAEIDIFTSPTCPYCPQAKAVLEVVSGSRSDVVVRERSLALSENMVLAQSLGVMSVPTIIINGLGQPVGVNGVPSSEGLNKAIDISLGRKEWPSEKGFFERLKEKMGL